MKIVITGGREYKDQHTIYRYLDWVHKHSPITLLINGVARGADTIARQWAIDRKIPYQDVPVLKEHWNKYGKKAGNLRNGWMLDLNPDCVIASPGNTGTADCIRQAKKREIKVIGPYIE